jgi:hypothetical protein
VRCREFENLSPGVAVGPMDQVVSIEAKCNSCGANPVAQPLPAACNLEQITSIVRIDTSKTFVYR